MLTLFNTRSLKKEEFTPQSEGVATLYHCGPTVYQYAHIGNLRSYVFADILKRALLLEGYKVKQVINITDVGHLISDADTGEDKVEEEAKKEGKTAQDIARFYTDAFLKDLQALNVDISGTQFPRATEYIKEQVALISRLEEKGYTYKTTDGIYFDTSRFPDYGKLGNINLTGLREGARVESNKEKKNQTDFALWKLSVPKNAHPEPLGAESRDEALAEGSSLKRQQEWESPWGVGFPGWHIECSAMSMKLLGETFDIHTGGIDHIPIHHNNEIAQSESATGKQFVRFWLHNAFVSIGDEKMAKSTGNFYSLEDLRIKGFHPLSYRYLLLTAHYRSPIHFSWEALEGAQTALKRLSEHMKSATGEVVAQYEKRFRDAIEDDLDTPRAVAVLWEMLKDISLSAEDKKATLLLFDRMLGLSFDSLTEIFALSLTAVPEKIKKLLEERETARKKNDWEKADELRKEIEKEGFFVKDTNEGPELEKIP